MNSKIDVTVFTPTYNRAYCLINLYKSLCRQTVQRCCWLIVDDGSTDNTEELVAAWQREGLVPIRYIKQSNKGMLGAHNTAYDNISSEFAMCVDSDDYLVDDAIETILDFWKKHGSSSYAGILGLDVEKNGDVLGDQFPDYVTASTFTDLKYRYKVSGDKKFVYRMEVINQFPRFPEFHQEKFPAASYLYRLIDEKYLLLLLNSPLCVVEYMPDGNSKQKFSQYSKNPNAFAYYRLECMRMAYNYDEKFRSAAHYISSCLFARKPLSVVNRQYPVTTLLALPVGVALHLYLRFTKKRGVMK